jgi:hypothetical protein
MVVASPVRARTVVASSVDTVRFDLRLMFKPHLWHYKTIRELKEMFGSLELVLL